MTKPDRPSDPEGSSFTHIDTMIAAYACATNEGDRKLYLRGIARGLQHVAGQLHARLGALLDAAAGPK